MSERMQYIHYDEVREELIVQLTGGGGAKLLRYGSKAEEVISGLRHLATLLERGIETRATSNTRKD